MSDQEEITPPVRFTDTLPNSENAAKAQAKRLRRNLTGPEAKLWLHLKRIATVDTHFRKQVPIGPYIADFACLRSRLIVEVDGEQHGFGRIRIADERRTAFLKGQGFQVLRFWNADILFDLDAVLDTIYVAVHGAVDAVPKTASVRKSIAGDAPSSPSMGEVASVASRRG